MTRSPLWKAEEICAAVDGAWINRNSDEPVINGISIDSRTTEPSDLFIAIVGPNSDGHDYVEAAFEKGAAAALVSRPDFASAGPVIVVKDTFDALNALGIAARQRTEAQVIAITGSVGKTGTKDALAAVLEENGRTHKSVLSYNNHWGVPLTLARMPKDTEFAVLELGMNHAGELTPLSEMVEPDVAVITKIAPAHMEAFDSLEDIAKAKAEIFKGLKKGGSAVINADGPYFELLSAAANAAGAKSVIGFGRNEKAVAQIFDSAAHQSFSCVRGKVGEAKVTYKIGAAGEHWIENSMAVLAAADAVGADLGRAGLTLARFQPPKGRGNEYRIPLLRGSYTLIDDSYNANPTSMAAALAALSDRAVDEGGRRIAILGDMLELGDQSAAFHRDLKEEIDNSNVDLVFGCGSETSHLLAALPAARVAGEGDEPDDLFLPVQDALHDGDVVLVKASRDIGLDRLIDYLRSNAELTHANAAEEQN